MELIVRTTGPEGPQESTVEMRRHDGGFEVKIGDRVYQVDRTAANGSIRSFLIEGQQYEISVRPDGQHRYLVTGSGGMEVVEVIDPLTKLAEESHAGVGGAAGSRVNAYMPGRVVTVLIEPGDEVTAGQGVVVLEAMKMENEIQAESAGVVTEVFVEPGQAVEGGDPLFEVG